MERGSTGDVLLPDSSDELRDRNNSFVCWPSQPLIEWICFRLHDYDSLQSSALILIYIQIACSLIGSLSAMYTGVLLVNLAVALFAIVAIESTSQGLGRAYAALLACSILLDIAWFVLFSSSIWNIDAEKFEAFFVFSLRLGLSMQILGFTVRFLSSFIWVQMYMLGVSTIDNTRSRVADFDVQNSFLNRSVHSDDHAYYLEDAPDRRQVDQVIAHDVGSTSAVNSPVLHASFRRAFHAMDGNNEEIAGDSPVLNACVSRSFHAADVEEASSSQF